VRDSGAGSRSGRPTADIETFTETQWVTLRSTVSECPFCVPAEDGIFLTQARALADGDVEAIMRIFGPDGYSRKREVVHTSIAKWTVEPRPASKH
jgi:hypothetical protein